MLLLLSLQSHLTLCDAIDGSPPGSPVPGILQARTLEWVAISFSNAWKWKVKVKSLSRVQLLTPWTAAYQTPLFMGFSRQEYWSGVPLPSPKFVQRQGKNITLVCFLLPLKREIKKYLTLEPISSIWRPLAFLPVIFSLWGSQCDDHHLITDVEVNLCDLFESYHEQLHRDGILSFLILSPQI